MAVPDRVGRYRIVRLLGTGGSSSVFLAHDPELDVDVAVKVLAENLARREDVVARFLAQARTLRAVNDPHVIGVHDVGVLDNGQPYFVMDLAPGPPLAEVDGLDVPQLAASVAALHAHGVVHGDLTPANIFVSADGRFVLADPGADGIGTPGYSAPEQEHGDPIDERADVYACTALVQRRVPRRSLNRFIARGLASDPDARPGDMQVWLADYHRAGRARWLVLASIAALVVAAAAIVATVLVANGGGDAEPPVYVADASHHQVTRDGVVFAGTGIPGDDGEGVRAVDAQLNAPRAAVEAGGVVYIADTANNRVRAVRNGIITTVAGTGADGSAGDNDLAKDAQLSAPSAIDVLPDGRVLVASGPRLRAFTPGGNITAYAGSTESGSTDGARDEARFSHIERIDARDDGTVFVTDSGRTRVVAPDGSVTTSGP